MSISIGTVIRTHVKDTIPPKIKFLIIVGFDESRESIATIFINTEIRPHVLGASELQGLQLCLQPSTCPFLNHESFADCSEIRERNFEQISKLILVDPKTQVGIIPKPLITDIIAIIKKAKTIPIKLKKKFNLTF